MPGPAVLLAALLLTAAVPAAWIASAGGESLDVAGLRLHLFQPGAALVAAGAAAWWVVAPVPGRRGARWLRAASLLAAAVAVSVVLSGGGRLGVLSVHDGLRPASLAWLGIVLAAPWCEWRALRWRARLLTLAAALALGGGLAPVLEILDARELQRRIEVSSRDAPNAGAVARLDVVWILVDTLRADRLGVYGARPSPSPWIDALAERSVVFERHLAQAPWTVPSMASLLTGLHPSTLAAAGSSWDRGREVYRFPAGTPSLATALADAGYHTAGFVKNPFLASPSGFARGFDVYEYVEGESASGRSAEQLARAALRWAEAFGALRRRGDPRPFFLYLHFMDPHIHYQPPRAWVSDAAWAYRGPLDGGEASLRALREGPQPPDAADLAFLDEMYRGEIQYLDHVLEELRIGLAGEGLWRDQTVVVLASDHGEQLGEHGGFGHGDLHLEEVRVPLLVRAPELPPRRVARTTGHLDLAPTLLDLLALPPLPDVEGRSLAAELRGRAVPPAAAGFAVTEIAASAHGVEGVRVTTDHHSLIRRDEEVRLFSASDTEERRDLAAERPAVRASLEALLARHRERPRPRLPSPGPPLERDAGLQRELEALGYLAPAAGELPPSAGAPAPAAGAPSPAAGAPEPGEDAPPPP